MALLTLAMVVTSTLQWNAIRGQLSQMRSESRSWVGLDDTIGFSGSAVGIEPDGAATTYCAILPKNFGDYPVTILTVHAELIVTQDPNRVATRIGEFGHPRRMDHNEHILFPGTDDGFRCEFPLSLPLSKRIIAPGRDDRFQVYILAYILYRDQYGQDHCTRVAYRSEDVNTDPPEAWFHLNSKYAWTGNWRICYAYAD